MMLNQHGFWSLHMERIAVRSSTIALIGYDVEALTLEVEFKNGTIYAYDGVPAEIHEGIMKCDSHGKYLNAKVKGRFPYRRVR